MATRNDYLIIHKKILPDCYEKTLETRYMLDSGAAKDVSAACRATGISRSTYYKYRDYVMQLDDLGSAVRKAVLSMQLNHEVGVLSACLNEVSSLGANVLTISQTMPIRNIAHVVLTLDITEMTVGMDEALSLLQEKQGVESAVLIAVE